MAALAAAVVAKVVAVGTEGPVHQMVAVARAMAMGLVVAAAEEVGPAHCTPISPQLSSIGRLVAALSASVSRTRQPTCHHS